MFDYDFLCLMCGHAFTAPTPRVRCYLCRVAPIHVSPGLTAIIQREEMRLANCQRWSWS